MGNLLFLLFKISFQSLPPKLQTKLYFKLLWGTKITPSIHYFIFDNQYKAPATNQTPKFKHIYKEFKRFYKLDKYRFLLVAITKENKCLYFDVKLNDWAELRMN